MIKIEQALEIILDSVDTLPSEKAPLTKALDRVLAEDIYSDCDLPLLDNSAMDGYALKAADISDASKSNPKILEVIGNLKAGYLAAEPVGDKQAIKIMTGAIIPEGADSVVMVEDTEGEGKDKVKIFKEAKPGGNIRRRGEDIKKGELLISKGTLLHSSHIGILASLGKSDISVTRRPKIGVLATGDEVIDVDEELVPGKIRSSNTYTLFSQIQKCGGIPKNLGIAKDQSEDIEAKLGEASGCDLILTSGGVSMGDYDLVKSVLAKMGTDIKFWKVAIRPGKPLVFGRLKGRPVFGLPGNPVSSMVSFETFVRPAILKMLGQEESGGKEVEAFLQEDLKKKKGFRYFLRAQTRWEGGTYLTSTTGPQGSGILKSMMLANSLIILPEDEEDIEKGRKVRVRFLD